MFVGGQSVTQIQAENFRLAQERGFPVFLTPERQSTPLTATPFVTTLSDIRSGAALGHRNLLMTKLLRAVDHLPDLNLKATMILIGGSTIGSKPDPSDVDAVVFYEAQGNPSQGFAKNLATIQKTSKQNDADIRFIPSDGDQIILARALIYYGMLYSKSEGSMNIERGLVLVDCR